MDVNRVRAVILAGGKGTRLRPLTTVFPKPLVPLGNKPIIEILMRRLSYFGIQKITICTGYLSEIIMAVCGDGEKYNLKIEYTKEETPLGTAGPLGLLKNLTDPFIVMNGDLLTTLNFKRIIEDHIEKKSDMTIGVYKRDVRIDFGVVESNHQSEFTNYIEKPTFNYEVSMGVNVISKAALAHIEKNYYMDMPDLVMKVHKNGGKVNCFREDCYWLDIGRMDDYALAQEQFEENEKMFLGEPS